MDNQSQIFQKFRCLKCERRLNKPLELRCNHFICRDCLETVLRNHRTDAQCPACSRPLGDYQIENYTYLSPIHYISRLLSTFTDVNECHTCKEFTTVKSCSECSKDQCHSCSAKHEETHLQIEEQPNENLELSNEELEILEPIKSYLSKKEFEDFIQTARNHVDRAILKQDKTIVYIPRNGSTVSVEKTPIWSDPEIYDWSKHERFSESDIINSKPERVRQLLRLDFNPRPYQIRMARPGLAGKNSIVCLQTGSGKTFIAAIVAKFLHIRSLQNVITPSSSSTSRFKAVFLVPIKALVAQQCAAFRQAFIDQPDSILKPIDNQVGERFKNLYQQFDIFFFTVQKFANFLEGKHADLTKFDLVIIDECHHCYDNHPINSMMRQYHRLKLSGYTVPQIIALTASVGTNKKNAFDHLVHVCANLDCLEICAIGKGVEEDELRNSTNTPLSDTILSVPKEISDPIVKALKDDVMKAIASRLGYDISMMDNQKLETFLAVEHDNACKKNDRDAIIGCDYLKKFHRFLIYYDDLPLVECIQWLIEGLKESTAGNPTQFDKFCRIKSDEFLKFVTIQISNSIEVKAKLKKLVEMIIYLHTGNCRGLVLVRTKFHAVSLETFLNKHSDLKKRQIFAGHLTGQGSAEELSLPGNQQSKVLDEFRKGTKQLLVATDVAQEGLDVAECSYVIRYEFVSNEIGTVQSRGRARASQSKCFLITEALSLNYQRETDNRLKEEDMKQAITEWREKGIQEFRTLVQKEQTDLLKNLSTNGPQPTALGASQPNKETAKTIHCRFCDTFLCRGSSLRLQGTTIVCLDPAFEKLVNPPKSAGEKVVCPNRTCHRELGAVILLSRNAPGYALQISSLKFFIGNEMLPRLFKKWSQYQGYMQPL
ncbi:unnamed protein product [Rotaria socialis]|uniref:RNA helicase n=2 Tax=Rotaria socialis TaxID=392032 RepID=A0A817Y1L6_9BILA|nr:unnamed protein product [Rotaria socialis]CAF4091110.1 unnamed protein product [Rotaria socialis]